MGTHNKYTRIKEIHTNVFETLLYKLELLQPFISHLLTTNSE